MNKWTTFLPIIVGGKKKAAWQWEAWPTHYKTVWQEYGADGSEFGIDYTQFGQCYHCGVDIKSGQFGEIMAVADGELRAIEFSAGGLGLYATIKHSEQYSTVYAHLSKVLGHVGERLQAGDVFALSGFTGNTVGEQQHLHIGQVDWVNGDKCCQSKYVNPEPFYSHLLAADGDFDMIEYLAGDGRKYRIRGSLGDEVLRTEWDEGKFYQCKNRNWEQLWADGDFIYRGYDISPGDVRYYGHYGAGMKLGAPWISRYMSVGDRLQSNKWVQFYLLHDCSPSDRNSGNVTDTIELVQHYKVYVSRHGYEMQDVIELLWLEGGERYFYGRDYGLIGWQNADGSRWSDIVELTDETHERERIDCIG